MEMRHSPAASVAEWLARNQTAEAVLFFDPARLQATARAFRQGFPGLASYAVKANPLPCVLENLAAAGIAAFDVASPAEIDLAQRHVPGAALHYNNPVRAGWEIDHAVARGVHSFSVDDASELEKLIARLPREGKADGEKRAPAEITVRFKLPPDEAGTAVANRPGAAYDFTSKFGALPELARDLLVRVAEAGFTPSLTFHPGTQCVGLERWRRHMLAAGEIARRAGVRLARLNVGGGFPAARDDKAVPRKELFAIIAKARDRAFPTHSPTLLCEPGRAMVAEAFTAAIRVRAVRSDGAVFLADGIYGLFAELPLIGSIMPSAVLGPDGEPRQGPLSPRRLFGPTCDSVDEFPGPAHLPADLAEGDWLVFPNMGAYSIPTATRFNGYGHFDLVTLMPRSSGPGKTGGGGNREAPFRSRPLPRRS